MNVRTRTRRRWGPVAGTLALLAGSAGPLAAQPPAAFPLPPSIPAAPLPPVSPPPEQPVASPAQQVEILHGTVKVGPIPTPAAPPVPHPELPQPVFPASAKSGPTGDDPGRTADEAIRAIRSLRDGATNVTNATANLLDAVADRMMTMRQEPRQIVFAGYAPAPGAGYPFNPTQSLGVTPLPQQTAPATPPAQQPQTIVVIREPAGESRPAPAPEPARGLTLTPETLQIVGLGVAALLGLVAVIRLTRRPVAPPAPLAPVIVAPPAPIDPNAVQLMGKYNAGPLPETAEKFELGLTYHEELQQKKQVEDRNDAAAVELILNQNLALLAALNPGAAASAEPTPGVLVDLQGYAVSAEAADGHALGFGDAIPVG